MNREGIEILKKLLEGQLQMYKSELEIVENKINYVEKDQLELLEKESEKEKLIIQKIEILEANRIKLVEKMGHTTLKELIEQVKDEKEKNSLRVMRKELKDVLSELKNRNELLQDLVKVSSTILEKTLNAITGSKEVGYKQDKQKTIINDSNLLNKKY